MTELWTRLKQRKLVQWAVACVAFAFALLQAVDIIATRFGWPAMVEKVLILLLCLGFLLTLILAWYHGEQGRQRVSGIELIILAQNANRFQMHLQPFAARC
jgi:protein-S-isoprenylcysteine O-methyltransferase Ste14